MMYATPGDNIFTFTFTFANAKGAVNRCSSPFGVSHLPIDEGGFYQVAGTALLTERPFCGEVVEPFMLGCDER